MSEVQNFSKETIQYLSNGYLELSFAWKQIMFIPLVPGDAVHVMSA